MKHILIVDDDIHIGDMLAEMLAREGYRISRAYSGTEALLVLAAEKPDLVLLDLMLPGLSGEEVLAGLKNIPVIVISAKVDVENKINLLLGGAADYVTKPFEPKELLARIKVQLRRSAVSSDTVVIRACGLQMDTAAHTVSAGETPVRLTRTEYAILKLLMRSAPQVMTKSTLLDQISMDTPDCTESSLKMHISNIRKKLRAACGRDCIEAVWGIGFRLNAE
jgi:two-component system, OmpR family, response regulator